MSQPCIPSQGTGYPSEGDSDRGKKEKEMKNNKKIRPLNRIDWCTYEHMETETAWDARAKTRSRLPNPDVVFI